MQTTVPSKNDLDKLLAKDLALEAAISALTKRVEVLEGLEIPPIPEPPQPTPTPVPEPIPEPVPAPAPAGTKHTRNRDVAPPSVVVDRSALARLVPPIDSALVKFSAKSLKEFGEWPGSKSFSGAEEAALVNNPTAEWLAGGDPYNMLLWAEGAQKLPVHFIDPDTGRMWNIREKPKANFYWRAPTFDGTNDSGYSMDTAHFPSLCYVPYLGTKDRFYLEELQFIANWHTLAQNPDYRLSEDRKTDLGIWQQTAGARGWAWHARDAVYAYLATPDGDLPAPLLPKSYWKWQIDNNRDYILKKWVNTPHSLSALHMAAFPNNDAIAPWQQDWIGAVLGFMVYTGQFDDWRPIYDWQIRQAIERTNGASGYPKSQAIQYWPKFKHLDGAPVLGMAEFAALNNVVETADGKFPQGFNTHYAESLRANLKLAVLNNVPEAAECFAYVNAQLPIPPDAKWCL